MRVGVLGTGMVGQAIAGKLSELDHEVVVGTRDPAATLARQEPDYAGNPPFPAWLDQHPKVRLAGLAEAAAHGELVVNATAGGAALEALGQAGEANLDGKVLVDVGNPLDFSKGMPPSLAVVNTDSLGEQLQRAFPGARVVKTLNTVNAQLMVNPRLLADGDHTVFVCGDDADAKALVTGLLTDGFGWRDVVDLGDISAARGAEMLMPLWLRLMGGLGTPMFNYKIVR
jgi:predicted dinucleotide-binding enzyme